MSAEALRTPGGVVIPQAAVRYHFVRSGGPGGQHVNTSATKVQVDIDLEACELDERRAERLARVLGSRVSASSSSSRSQWRNRERALQQALVAIDDALFVPRSRVATKATRSAQERRLQNKARHAQIKRQRRWRDDER
jgi:ribosome-associated protein